MVASSIFHVISHEVTPFPLITENPELNGVDFDWEYPGAQDIPHIKPGSKDEGANYLSFLRTLRSLLPEGKSLSIAIPSSYWYLRGFPVAEMSNVVDYFIYMTYDLHGRHRHLAVYFDSC